MEEPRTHDSRSAEGVTGPSSRQLVFAVCHEVANLLAGTRLEASLLEGATGPEASARVARRIESASARAGSLLALVRPLLDPESVESTTADPLELLHGLRSGLDEHCDARVSIELKSAVELPPVRVPAEPLYHLLVSAIYYGLESDESGRVRVRADAADGGVAFSVADPGTLEAPSTVEALRGRPLLVEIAKQVAASHGGAVESLAQESGARMVLAFPAETR